MRLALALCLLPLPAFAICDEAQTQVEMTTCAAAAYQEADGLLNANYKLAMASAKQWDADNPGAKAADALKAAQRAWIPYRDATCAAEAVYYAGGSIEGMVLDSCLARVTQTRADELLALTEGE